MTDTRYSNAALRAANRYATLLEADIIAKAIRDVQARIKADPNIGTAQAQTSQLRGVRRTAAHIANALDDKTAVNFLIACGYGA